VLRTEDYSFFGIVIEPHEHEFFAKLSCPCSSSPIYRIIKGVSAECTSEYRPLLNIAESDVIQKIEVPFEMVVSSPAAGIYGSNGDRSSSFRVGKAAGI